MISDHAITELEQDLFGRKNFSKRIAEIIAQRSEEASIVIGIHAHWGEGKTSVLNMIVEYLDKHTQKKDRTLLDGHIVLVKFNPWRFPDEEKLLRNFFNSLADALESSVETKIEKVGKFGRKYSRVAAIIDLLKVKFGDGTVSIEPNVSETIRTYAELLPEADVEKWKDRVDEILKSDGRKIVVTMDDIDRLDKEEIQAVFRLVKLTADFPNTIYIMCFDEDRVAEALEEKSGRDFTEKIIQLSRSLPPLTAIQLIRLTFDRINALWDESLDKDKIKLLEKRDGDWSYFFRTTFGSYLKSPRLIKRYISNLWFSIPHMKDELDILDLQTIEAVNIFFPKLYKIIRKNKNMFLLEPLNQFNREAEENEHIANLKQIPSEFPEQERKIIQKIIQHLFPRTSGAFANNSYGTDWYDEWTKDKRIASPKYFQRYFDLGISDDDISDVVLQNFVDQLVSKNDKQNVSELAELLSNNRERLFLEKISLLIDSLEESVTTKLAKAVALSGDLFPKGDNDSIILTLTPLSDAARLLRHILENVADEKRRFEIAIEIAQEIRPLDFAYEYFRFVKYIGKEKNEDELTFLGKTVISEIVKRIELEAEEENLEERYPDYSAKLYHAWLVEKKESVKTHLKNRFTKNPLEAEAFIFSFYKQNVDVNGVAIVWGFDFVISAIDKVSRGLQLLPLENYTKESHYLWHNKYEYLEYFVSITKKIISEENNQ